MKLFGEYLVDQGLISKKELLEALLVQVKNIPSMAECIFEAKLLSDDDLLEALKYQASHYVDLLSALKQLGKWNEVLEQKVKAQIAERRVPLGQLLVKHGKLDFEALVKHLDDFIYESRKEVKQPHDVTVTPNQVAVKDEPAVPTKTKVQIMKPTVRAKSDFNPELGDIDPILLEGFFDIFNESAFTLLDQSLDKLAGGTVGELVATYNSFLLGARFIQCSLVEKLSEELVDSLKAVINPGKPESAVIVKSANKLLRELFSSLSVHKTERSFWDNEASKTEFLEVLEVLRNCRESYEEAKCAS